MGLCAGAVRLCQAKGGRLAYRGAVKTIHYGETGEKERASGENLRCVWAAVHLAQEMGTMLGRGALLLGALSSS